MCACGVHAGVCLVRLVPTMVVDIYVLTRACTCLVLTTVVEV